MSVAIPMQILLWKNDSRSAIDAIDHLGFLMWPIYLMLSVVATERLMRLLGKLADGGKPPEDEGRPPSNN